MALEPPPAERSGGRSDGRRLRIAFVYDALFPFQRGGAERRYFELARRLAEAHEVHSFSWRHWDGPATVVADGVTFHGVGSRPRLYGSDGKRTVREAVSFAARAGLALAGRRFDVIDCSATPYVPLYAGWGASRFPRSPLVATWHELWGEHWRHYLPHRPAVQRAGIVLESWAARFGDQIVAVSPFTAARLRRRMGPTRRIDIVENGINFSDMQKATPAAGAARVVFVGRLIEDKGVDTLLRALSVACEHLPDLRCDIIGEGPERPRLEALAAALGLRQAVRFLGCLEDGALYGQMKGAEIFVLPSIREGFGIAVLEAQACGAVPIVARAPGSAASDLVSEGCTGFICPPDPEAFAARIIDLAGSPALRGRMAAEAVASASVFDWGVIARRMEAVYVRAAAARRPGEGQVAALAAQQPVADADAALAAPGE
jgi:glycosyltransferase involved in cell wall biosynthesis